MDRTQFQAYLVQKATSDLSFRAALLSDPRRTIEDETGLGIPASIGVTVIEETAEKLCLVLPATAGELSDLELEAVAGGCGSGDRSREMG